MWLYSTFVWIWHFFISFFIIKGSLQLKVRYLMNCHHIIFWLYLDFRKTSSYFCLFLQLFYSHFVVIFHLRIWELFVWSIPKNVNRFLQLALIQFFSSRVSGNLSHRQPHKMMLQGYKHNRFLIHSIGQFLQSLIFISALSRNNSHSEKEDGSWTSKMGIALALCLEFHFNLTIP